MPGNKSTVYDASAVTLNFATQTIDHGRGEEGGTFLEIAQQNEDIGYKGSVSGFGTFFKKGNRYTIVRVTLPQTSNGNDVMMAIHIASQLLGGSPAPIGIKDQNGNSKFASDAAMIIKTPDETFAEEPGTVVWELGVHDPARFVGGH
jgi:hypothetical protein